MVYFQLVTSIADAAGKRRLWMVANLRHRPQAINLRVSNRRLAHGPSNPGGNPNPDATIGSCSVKTRAYASRAVCFPARGNRCLRQSAVHRNANAYNHAQNSSIGKMSSAWSGERSVFGRRLNECSGLRNLCGSSPSKELRKNASYWSRQFAVWIAAIAGAILSAEVLPEMLASRWSVLLPK
jgi:hypothetical protein